MQWVNRFRLKSDQTVVSEFRCSCAPWSYAHQRMVSGALINMNANCYLEDGVPADEPEVKA